MDLEIKSVQDVVDILKRRRWSIIVATLAVFAAGVILALTLPKKYRSTATILIEAQEVPTEYVKANITSFADQRLQAINQRITGTPKLLEIIKRYDLYNDVKSRLTMEEIVDQMRKKDIKFNTISADVVDPRSGRPAQATIAFSVSYTGRTPEIAQQVTNELCSFFMEENLKVREQQSAVTSRFLGDELKSVQTALVEVEGRITSFKQKNINTLPDVAQMNLQSLEQVDRDIRQLTDQQRTLREKESYLQNQLASVSPELENIDKESLRQLRLKLTDLKSRFSDEYPDVIKTRAEIAGLERQMAASGRNGNASRPDNPAYITLASQLAGIRSEMDSMKRQITDLSKKRVGYRSRILSSPRVEEGYKAMMVERDTLQQKYEDLSRKVMEAKVAHGLEKEQLGERFTLVDPPRLPERPLSPNRMAIILTGFILGLGMGIIVAMAREYADQTIYNANSLVRLTGLPVLVTVPEITTASTIKKVKYRRLMVVTACAVAGLCLVVTCHYLVMDIDVVGAKMARLLARYR